MTSPLRILHLENDAADAELVEDTLTADGVASDVTRVETEPEFVAALQRGGFDVILADYTLPSFDGLSALSIVRQRMPDVPFIFVSGTMGEEVAIEALKIGATDYVLKTGLSRLAPAVHRALREARERAERKQTQEQLRRSEAYLAEAEKLSHTGSFGWNPSSGEIYWSRESFRIFEFEPASKITIERVMQRIHPEDRAAVQQSIERFSRERKEWDVEYRLLMPNGSVKYLRARGQPSMHDGHFEYVGIAMDVTEHKRAEAEREKLHQLESDLAHINRVSMLGELAASLSHELKQPVAATMMNAKTCMRWLKRDDPDIESACETVARIMQDAGRAIEVIDRLRSLYKKSSPAERELVDANEIIREMLVLLHNEADRYSIPMRTDLAPEIPRVRADRVQLQQVFLNLMLNGIEAMKDSGGELTVKTQASNDGHVLISVSDTGVGLPPEKAGQIFNAFFTTKPQGSGMGLAISRSIIESHGGRLWATDNPGRGAAFHFTLPTAVAFAEPVHGGSDGHDR